MDLERLIVNSRFRVRVFPNAKKNVLKGFKDNIVLVDIAAPADKNKANLEVVKFFSRLLKKKVSIKSGLKSKDKLLFVH
ncbi:MAG: DUF167 domain-containing protein [Nanoarchaeota archaeon]|nr:DUF167 domain-containing protein [Nanoarchaeota archaeon]MBU1854739.1 DUF167 domain-containing protein [Nanoarchaeota archaeon]